MEKFHLFNADGEELPLRYNSKGQLIESSKDCYFIAKCDQCGKLCKFTLKGYTSKRGRITADSKILCRGCNKINKLEESKKKSTKKYNFELWRKDLNRQIDIPAKGNVPFCDNYFIKFKCQKCGSEDTENLSAFHARKENLNENTILLCRKCRLKKKYENPNCSFKDPDRQKILLDNRRIKVLPKIKKICDDANVELIDEYIKKNNFRGGSFKRYLFKCKKCGKTFKDFFDNQHLPFCPYCNSTTNVSKGELYFRKYIEEKGYDVIPNDREILEGKEIDIYIPSKKIGFEYDGLYWHSKKEKEDPGYHERKNKIALQKGIKLIHLLEPRNKKEIESLKEKINLVLEEKE